MTNHWTDIANTSLVFAIGCNPAENHPAVFQHINAARFGSKQAKLVVVDPRQTRTARQIDPTRGDMYVRIRPGTDIAFINGIVNYIMNNIGTVDAGAAANMVAWHNSTAPNSTANRAAIADDGTAETLGSWPKYCDSRVKVDASGVGYQRGAVTGTGGKTISNVPVLAATIDDPECVYQKLKAHVAPYTTAVVADICGCTEQQLVDVANVLIANSRFKSSDFGVATATPADAGYRATALLYAMGATQHTYGSQNVRSYAVLQVLMGNMGRAGGGIDALRGIHNVQGSTDFGNLFDSIPGYSGNPSVGQSYPDYVNHLFGNRLINGTGTTTARSPYTPADLGLQQRGFWNMTQEWFGTSSVTAQADFDKLYALWPKGNGYQHIEAFRRMETGQITASLVWGENPAISEPNQSAVRNGLKNLQTLVVVDTFLTETAACDRKDTGVTYLIPACSYVEEAGSVTNSGRWLQWRQEATKPKGNSKSDVELMLRLAKALDTAGAFSHITGQWATLSTPITGSAYDVLYAKYGWTPGTAFESASGTDNDGNVLTGSELICENLYKELARPLPTGGTMWIYSGGAGAAGWDPSKGDQQPAVGTAWPTTNRAKSRVNSFAGGALNYPRWGWAWLLNRRVFYNNGEVPNDVLDVFVNPGFLASLFVMSSAADSFADFSTLYRAWKSLSDKPDAGLGDPHVLPGRFPAHTEPYETPRLDLKSKWGKNTANGTSLLPAVGSPTAVGTPDVYPLVLTSIRCVEHFQGGPTTRNNSYNVELEPEPWVEINPVDARKYGILDGDYVNVVTARSDSKADQEGRTVGAAGFAKGFRARVDSSIAAYQRVAPGVVAIPWHWGERGLGTGSRANDLCIDAFDANTTIPEYKACLCRIEKA